MDGDALLADLDKLFRSSSNRIATLFTDWWKRSLRKYSSGSFGLTSAPSGTASQSTSRVSRKRIAAPRASTGSAARSAADSARTLA